MPRQVSSCHTYSPAPLLSRDPATGSTKYDRYRAKLFARAGLGTLKHTHLCRYRKGTELFRTVAPLRRVGLVGLTQLYPHCRRPSNGPRPMRPTVPRLRMRIQTHTPPQTGPGTPRRYPAGSRCCPTQPASLRSAYSLGPSTAGSYLPRSPIPPGGGGVARGARSPFGAISGAASRGVLEVTRPTQSTKASPHERISTIQKQKSSTLFLAP